MKEQKQESKNQKKERKVLKMEQNVGLNTKELISTNDLSTYQYRFVQADTSAARSCILGSLNCEVTGVLQNKPKAGEMAIIAIGPQPKVVAGAAVNIGDDIISDAAGCAIPKGATSSPIISGRALNSATAGPQGDGTYQVIQIDSRIASQ